MTAAGAPNVGPLANTQDDGWMSGAAKGAATGVIKGLAHIPGWIGDADDLSTFLAAGAASIFDSRSATDIYKSMKAKSAALPTALKSPGTLAPNAGDVAAPVLAKTGEYKPTSEIGQLAQAGVEAAAGGLGPGVGGAAKGFGAKAILAATAKQAPLNAIAGVAGQGATDATGNPYIGLAASLAAPSAAEGAGHAAHAAVGSSLEDLPVIGGAFAGTRDANVGKTIASTFADPAKRDAFMDSDPNAAPLVAGAQPTLGQQTGDFGVLRAEEKARTADNVPFLDREQDANSARRAALASMAPADADTMAPSRYLQSRAAQIDQADAAAQSRIIQHAQDLAAQLGPGNGADANGQAIGAALDRVRAGQQAADQGLVGQAQAAAAPLGQGNAPDINGQGIIDALEASKAQARALRSHLYDPATIDPDGSLNLVTKPAADGAKALAQGVDPLGAPVGGDAARIMGKMQALPDVLPYKSVMALDSDITASMAKERRANGESPDWRMLSLMKGHVMDAINGAVDNRHEYEQNQVAAGQMQPDETSLSRMRDTWDLEDVGTTPDSGSVAARAGVQIGRSGDTAPAGSGSDFSGNQGAQSRGLSQAPSDQAVSRASQASLPLDGPKAPFYDPSAMERAPQRPGVPRPQNLHDFIRQAGGMQDPGGDLKSMGMDRLIAKPGQGMSPDAMREAAAERGFLGGDTAHAMHSTDINDLLNAVEVGDRRYAAGDEDAVHAYDQYDTARSTWQRQQGDSEGRSSPAGMRPKAPLSSYGIDDIYAPGTAPTPPSPANGGLTPNADQAALDRINAAKRFHADYAQTFQKGPVKDALQTSGFTGQYAKPAGALPGKAIPAGPAGYEITKGFLKAANYENAPAFLKGSGSDAAAGGQNGRALAEMKDQALAPLRAATVDGMLPQKAVDAWKAKYGPALRALDEASPGFSTQFDRAGAAHSAVMAAREHLKANDPTAGLDRAPGAIPKAAVQTGDTGYGTLKRLFDTTKNDPSVIAAVQDHVLQPLRRTGLTPEATVSPKALADWKASYGPALKAIDEVSPGFSSKLDTAAKATDIMARAGAARQANMDAVQKSSAAKLMGKTDPGEVESTIMGMLTDAKKGPTQVRELRQALAAHPDALAGAQKAAVDGIVKRFVNTAESGTSGEKSIASAALQKFVANNQATLRGLLPSHSVDTLQAVAASLEQANRDITGTRIKGTSQTAKNQHGDLGKLAHAGAHSAIGVALVEGMMQAYEHGGVHGAALAGATLGAGYALNKFRAGGLSKEQGMVRDALLNPDRARMYMSKVPVHDPAVPYRMLSNSLRRSLITTPIVKGSYQGR